ncbi:hypothetical protein C8F04DRAFT_983903, partial [Mycena alexandri]
DNLRPNLRYITSWPANGWSNQVIQYMNLIYLAQLTERVPIIPRFRPVHMGANASHLDFSDVFDLPRLQQELGMTSVLEWRQIKDLNSETVDELGCWDIQDKTWEADRLYLEPPVDLKLDISYSRAPEWVRASDGGASPKTLLWPLASLVYLTEHTNGLERLPAELSPLHRVELSPDEHLFCCNSMYFGVEMLGEVRDISPAWHAVGRHMRWTAKVEEIAMRYVRQTLGVTPRESIPPFFAVHIRRGDFVIWCNIAGVTAQECFAPLSAFARRVDEMRAALFEGRGVSVERVIVTSDEEDPDWWAAVSSLGWLRPDHSQTVELYGPWYPMFIDAVIQSTAAGFVGTDTSTVSILSRRRVAEMGGLSEMVRWGWRGADDH